MASDITLYIFDPHAGAIVCSCWLGMGHTLEALKHTLNRPADFCEQGRECWGQLKSSEALKISESSYIGGGIPQSDC